MKMFYVVEVVNKDSCGCIKKKTISSSIVLLHSVSLCPIRISFYWQIGFDVFHCCPQFPLTDKKISAFAVNVLPNHYIFFFADANLYPGFPWQPN